jgi:pyrroloquinoline quinone biosynthesis protein B
LARDGDPRVIARTQTSVAVSADGQDWALLNAAPDLSLQIQRTPELHPRGEARGSPIRAVLLTGGEVDQVAGLLSLRERHAFTLHAAAATLAELDANPIFGVLDPALVPRRPATLDEPFRITGQLDATLLTVPGKVPLYREGQTAADGGGSTVGIEIEADGARLTFVPGIAELEPALIRRLGRADVVLFDGTLFQDDEMIRAGVGEKTGIRMGHMPIDGPNGSLAALAGLKNRRIYIHINNTNPILIAGSPERRTIEAAGWEIAQDGQEIVL